MPPRRVHPKHPALRGAQMRDAIALADSSWECTPEPERWERVLSQANVAVLGGGSLGDPVARLLTQAGIGSLLVLDGDILAWKAVPSDFIKALKSCDAVVSLAIHWPAQLLLNRLQQETPGFPPILYSWVEPHGAAGHVVHIPRGEACLGCGLDARGLPRVAVSHWPEDRQIRMVPHGPVGLFWTHALISQAIVDALTGGIMGARHRVWIGRRAALEDAGGTWDAAWVAEMGDPGEGGTTVERSWASSASCIVGAHPRERDEPVALPRVAFAEEVRLEPPR